MHRFYADEGRSTMEKAWLAPEDARHALTVLRLKPGETVEVFWNFRRYQAQIAEITDGEVALSPLIPLSSVEPALSITLFQALPKADKMDWIVQKSVELGVARFVPVRMQRCVVRLEEKDIPRKTERWQRIAHEAGKQSGRSVEMEVLPPQALSALPGLFSGLDAVMVPWEECGQGGPRAFQAAHPALSSLGIVIGPEGGIDPREMELLTDAACVPVTLGPRILRTETASLAAVSAILALYGEME